MIDKTDIIEFKSYRFPNNKIFLFTKEDLKQYRKLEKEIIKKEMELYELIKDKELKNEGE